MRRGTLRPPRAAHYSPEPTAMELQPFGSGAWHPGGEAILFGGLTISFWPLLHWARAKEQGSACIRRYEAPGMIIFLLRGSMFVKGILSAPVLIDV